MIIWDTETTGLYSNTLLPLKSQPAIIELFCLKLNDDTLEEVDTFHSLINPGFQISEEITRITGIKNDDLKDAPAFVTIQGRLAEFWLGQRRHLAHNCSFDMQMLSFELQRTASLQKFPWPMLPLCSVQATEHLRGQRLKLGDLYELLFERRFEGAHRAEQDVRALADCYRELVKRGEM